MEKTGLITKALSGYYYVQADEGGPTIQCRGRGIFKKRGESPLVGDRVIYQETSGGEGTVDHIMPRSSELIRPPIANASKVLLVFSVVHPRLNLLLLDKFLAHIAHAGLEALIVLTKLDRIPDGAEGDTVRQAVADAVQLYTSIGYEVLATSALRQEGIEELGKSLSGHINVFAGQSGVGKSSLLNALVPGLDLATNEISHKLGRGKHTTRHVELIPLSAGGYLADTPGFSQLDFAELGIEDIGSLFREMKELSAGCKFRGCTHTHEPGCAVREAIAEERIAASRYDHYVAFLTEWKETRRRY